MLEAPYFGMLLLLPSIDSKQESGGEGREVVAVAANFKCHSLQLVIIIISDVLIFQSLWGLQPDKKLNFSFVVGKRRIQQRS